MGKDLTTLTEASLIFIDEVASCTHQRDTKDIRDDAIRGVGYTNGAGGSREKVGATVVIGSGWLFW